MKKEAILKLIKLPEGVEFDVSTLNVDSLVDDWNRQLNGMKKAYGEEVEKKAVSDLLSKYGLENEEAIKTLQDSTKTNADKENEKILALETTLQELQSNLADKDAKLIRTDQISQLSKLGIKDERLEKAYKLISSDVTEENDFNTVAQQFVKDTPEWLGKGQPSIKMGGDSDNKDDNVQNEDAKALENAWG